MKKDIESKMLEALLEKDGIEVKNLEGTTDEALAALLELLAYKGFVDFQEFGKFYQSIIDRRENPENS